MHSCSAICCPPTRRWNAGSSGIGPHAYVRYLGDLNGGQILKRVLGKALALGPAHLSFYDFPAIADLTAFTGLYRTAFDTAGGQIAAVQPLLDEADAAFQFNIDISDEVRRLAG